MDEDSENEFSDDSTDEDDDDESIYNDEDLDEELLKEKSEIMFKNIELFVNNKYEKYNLEDYICLIDNISNDKILIGLIKKITDKYIMINDHKIPIVNNNDNKIVLYKVQDRKTFINDLGLKIIKFIYSIR